jgi:hypothetical protein
MSESSEKGRKPECQIEKSPPIVGLVVPVPQAEKGKKAKQGDHSIGYHRHRFLQVQAEPIKLNGIHGAKVNN